MKVPQTLLQVDYVSPDQYVVLLPLGVYQGGTYTLPGGRTWNDFSLIAVVTKDSSNVASSCQFVSEQFNDTAWVKYLGIHNQDSETGIAYIYNLSATQYAVGTTQNDRVLFFYGYLK